MSDKTFAGRPIEGDICKGNILPDQKPESEFTDALNKLLSTEGIEFIKWSQFTPFFNDGDACVFGVQDARVRLIDASDEDSDYDDGTLDRYSLEDGIVKTELKAFQKVLDSGAHNVLLGKLFGDHAEVTATKEKFVVESYEHD